MTTIRPDTALRHVPAATLAVLTPLTALAMLTACGSTYHLPPALTDVLEPEVVFGEPAPDLLRVQFHRGLVVLEPGSELSCQLQIDLSSNDHAELARLKEQVRPSLGEADGVTTLAVALPKGADINAIATRYNLRVPTGVRVHLTTREGGVCVRGFSGEVSVETVRGPVELQLDGGSATVSTDSGNIRLAGDYREARIVTESGRVEAALPQGSASPFHLELSSARSDVLIDLQKGQTVDLAYRGDILHLHSEPDVRVDWSETDGGGEFRTAKVGGRAEPADGKLVLDTDESAVRFRRSPLAGPPRSAPAR